MKYDPTGHSVVGLLILIAAITIIGGTLAGVVAYNNGERGEDLALSIIKGVAIGFIVGGAIALLGGVGAGVTTFATGHTSLFLGVGAAQTFAIGALSMNIASVVIGPLIGVVDAPVVEMGTTSVDNSYLPTEPTPTW